MPATFTAVRGAFTPSLTNDNYTLHGVGLLDGVVCVVRSIGWGGRTQQSISYRTRWVHPSSGSIGSATNLTVQSSNPAQTNVLACASTFATTQPTLPAEPENLFAVDWNTQGGEGVLNLHRAHGWRVIAPNFIASRQQGQISCRNVVGTDANGSDYWVTWEE